jgi:23S rRNA-/tRNA-specific pseudouridylate synthase
VVIDKPSSIPVHPCGRYRQNSILFILSKEHNLKNLHSVHRLDRLTSGLLVLAKNKKEAARFSELMQNKEIKKRYIALVHGAFPEYTSHYRHMYSLCTQRGSGCESSYRSESGTNRYQ